jgi:pyridoxine 5-phosphate synthase
MTRVYLREHTLDDLEAYHDWQSDPEVARQVKWLPKTRAQSEADLIDAVAQQTAHPRQRYFYAVIDPFTGEMVGDVGFTIIGPGVGDGGWFVRRRFWGRGFATAAVEAMIGIAFGATGLERLTASCAAANATSERVMQKCGFRRGPNEPGRLCYELEKIDWERTPMRWRWTDTCAGVISGQSAMTKLSVNINKIALLRNSRGRNYPDVRAFAARCLELGAHGITLHPRPDQRHARYGDVEELQRLCAERGAELNVEGFPSAEFLTVVRRVRPAQCTLVPDAPGQVTTDHGWDFVREAELLRRAVGELTAAGIRVSLFADYDQPGIERAREIGADRVELYTEPYAVDFGSAREGAVLDGFRAAAMRAQRAGLGVNAGHDLNLENLARFLAIPGILEVSIGHALVVECIGLGMETAIARYLRLVAGSETSTMPGCPV